MTALATNLGEMIAAAGEDWLINWFSPRENALRFLKDRLAKANSEAERRLGTHAPNLSEEGLVTVFSQSPTKVKALLQILGSTRTPAFLLMAWRIILGAEIKSLAVNYQVRSQFELRVVLESPTEDGADDVYESNEIHDFMVLGHLGIMEIEQQPVFEGFYPLNLQPQ